MHFFPPPTKPDPQVNFVPQTWSSNRNASVATACITRQILEGGNTIRLPASPASQAIQIQFRLLGR
uniref:Uncharacterized protein n=1 Tax=Vitis vinifera TaxID=29760 RepID=F6HG48_VITVI